MDRSLITSSSFTVFHWLVLLGGSHHHSSLVQQLTWKRRHGKPQRPSLSITNQLIINDTVSSAVLHAGHVWQLAHSLCEDAVSTQSYPIIQSQSNRCVLDIHGIPWFVCIEGIDYRKYQFAVHLQDGTDSSRYCQLSHCCWLLAVALCGVCPAWCTGPVLWQLMERAELVSDVSSEALTHPVRASLTAFLIH